MARLRRARMFGNIYMLRGFWQFPPLVEAQEVFTTLTPTGLYTPLRVPQGVLNATGYF